MLEGRYRAVEARQCADGARGPRWRSWPGALRWPPPPGRPPGPQCCLHRRPSPRAAGMLRCKSSTSIRALVPPLSPRRRRASSQKRSCTGVKAPDARALVERGGVGKGPGLSHQHLEVVIEDQVSCFLPMARA